MITINNKSRYFSASEDMFPTMERNFAWLFGMQTPEQGWKTVLAITIMYRAQGSAEEENGSTDSLWEIMVSRFSTRMTSWQT